MPTLVVVTNAVADKAKEMEFLKEASAMTAECLGKPEAYVTVRVQTGASLIFGGTDEPAAQCDLFCIGVLSQAVNHKYSAGLAPLLEKYFGIAKTRYYITYAIKERHEIGYNGSTFAGPA
uniref:L-dopachrome isomerase n=1 Tax=Eutreptiella gymnastica TaxID=73025 RepID=A0A7S4C702_9EUGL